MELKHNFYGVNFAPFPRRGVLNSETAHRSMAAMVEATAANWVILSPSGIQSGPYSEEIDWRTDATPTDEEVCGATAQEQAFKEKLYRDPLTGIYNRRYYEEVARKTIGPAGVALMDVDDFKICNDTYGHHAGDMALKTVANTIQSCIRKSDLLIRYGGDEFLLVLPGIPGDFLQTKLEQICTAAQMASVPGYSHFRTMVTFFHVFRSRR